MLSDSCGVPIIYTQFVDFARFVIKTTSDEKTVIYDDVML